MLVSPDYDLIQTLLAFTTLESVYDHFAHPIVESIRPIVQATTVDPAIIDATKAKTKATWRTFLLYIDSPNSW